MSTDLILPRTPGTNAIRRDNRGFEDCGLTLINPWEMP
jgi:hypothetical protein